MPYPNVPYPFMEQSLCCTWNNPLIMPFDWGHFWSSILRCVATCRQRRWLLEGDCCLKTNLSSCSYISWCRRAQPRGGLVGTESNTWLKVLGRGYEVWNSLKFARGRPNHHCVSDHKLQIELCAILPCIFCQETVPQNHESIVLVVVVSCWSSQGRPFDSRVYFKKNVQIVVSKPYVETSNATVLGVPF